MHPARPPSKSESSKSSKKGKKKSRSSAFDFSVHLFYLFGFLAHVGQLPEDEECIAVVNALVGREITVLLDGVHLVRFNDDEILLPSPVM